MQQSFETAGDESDDHDDLLDLGSVGINQTYVSTKRPTNTTTPNMLTKKQKKEVKKLNILKKTVACMEKAMADPVVIHEQEDSLSIFGKYVAGELREMNPSQVRFTKIRIQLAIIEVQAQSAIEHLGGTQLSGVFSLSASEEHQVFQSVQLNNLNS